MKAKQIFNGIFFVNLLAVIVIFTQMFTGYFIDPGIQVAILTMVNFVFRLVTGKAVIEDVKAPLGHKIDAPKIWYESKMLWISVISFTGAMIQSITGWAIPEESYLQIVSGISVFISIVTHKPVQMT